MKKKVMETFLELYSDHVEVYDSRGDNDDDRELHVNYYEKINGTCAYYSETSDEDMGEGYWKHEDYQGRSAGNKYVVEEKKCSSWRNI